MTQGNILVDPTDVSSLLRLVLEQQRAIKDLIEDITKDIDHLKDKTDDISVIKARLESLEKSQNICQNAKGECQLRIERTFNEIVQKREGLNSKIASVELELSKRINDQSKECTKGIELIRLELENKVGSKTKEIFDVIKDIQIDIKGLSKATSYEAGKYGGIVALIITIIMFLAKTLWEHVIKK